MEDIASVVLDQLKQQDGPAPFALVHHRFGSHFLNDARWLVINAERVNGTFVYKVNVASAEWHRATGAGGSPIWTTITFEDEKATVAFATAFLRHEDNHRLELRELHLDKWHASRSTASFSDCLSRQYGSYLVATETDLLLALRALKPLSMIVGEKRVF